MATQKELASHLDLQERRVRGLLKLGILPPSQPHGGLDLDACRLAYIRYLRGVQSGQVRPAGGEIDGDDNTPATVASNDYTALLEQERYRRIKRENDLEENLVAPVSVLTDALIKSGRIIIANLENIPLMMKRAWPEITGDQVTIIKKVIAEARNTIADMNINVDEP